MATGFEAIKAQRARFADFELGLSSGELIRNGRRLRLQGQPFQVLCVLLDRSGQVVTREELQRQLWPDETFVDFDHGLNKPWLGCREVKEEALEDTKASSRLIETVPHRGYRLNAEVQWVGPEPTQPPLLEAPPPHKEGRRFPSHYWLASGVALTLLLAVAIWFNRRTVLGWFGHSLPSSPLRSSLFKEPVQ